MSNIFSTNNQAERFLRPQQGAAVRPDDLGARRAEKRAPAAAGSSNAEFLKARADAGAFEKTADNEATSFSAIENSREAASERPEGLSERATYDRSSIDKESVRTTTTPASGGQTSPDNIPENIEGSYAAGDGSLPRGGGTRQNEGAVALPGAARSEENTLEFATTTRSGGSDTGLLYASLDQKGAGKNAGVSPGKASIAYETVAANSVGEFVAVPGDTAAGEAPKLVNAKAGAYSQQSVGGGVQAVPAENAVGADGIIAGAGEDMAGILKGGTVNHGGMDSGADDAVGNGVMEDTADLTLDTETKEKSAVAGGGGKAAQQGAGKDTTAAAAGAVTALKTAYVEASDTKEKGAKKEGGEEQSTQKSSDPSSKKTASQKVVSPVAEQASTTVEEPASPGPEAGDSAEFVEAVTGKEKEHAGAGLKKDSVGGGSKPDTAVLKNDLKAEAVVQSKDMNTSVKAADKTAAAPKTLNNFGKLQEGIFNAVDRGVRLSLASGGQDARLTLRPESLGELRIKLSIGEDGQVQSKIMVDSAAVKGILDSDAARLRGIFGERGLDLESYSVEVGSGWSGPGAGGDGPGFGLNGRGAQRAYGNATDGGVMELSASVMAEGVYGAPGGAGLDLFA